MIAKDDTFELLTTMYADFTLQFKELRGDVSTLKGKVSKIELKLENEVDKKLDILLETREETNHRLNRIEEKLDVLSTKVEKHDLEILSLKTSK